MMWCYCFCCSAKRVISPNGCISYHNISYSSLSPLIVVYIIITTIIMWPFYEGLWNKWLKFIWLFIICCCDLCNVKLYLSSVSVFVCCVFVILYVFIADRCDIVDKLTFKRILFKFKLYVCSIKMCQLLCVWWDRASVWSMLCTNYQRRFPFNFNWYHGKNVTLFISIAMM